MALGKRCTTCLCKKFSQFCQTAGQLLTAGAPVVQAGIAQAGTEIDVVVMVHDVRDDVIYCANVSVRGALGVRVKASFYVLHKINSVLVLREQLALAF